MTTKEALLVVIAGFTGVLFGVVLTLTAVRLTPDAHGPEHSDVCSVELRPGYPRRP